MSSEETKKEETTEVEKKPEKQEKRGRRDDSKGRNDSRSRSAKPGSADGVELDYEERVVSVQRVSKVVKGGRRFSFSALMIVGDKKGRVGYGLGKAKEVPDAIRKAGMEAKNNMVNVPIEKGTIPHTVLGEYDAGKVLFRPAAAGTGVKAAGACRSILELAGIENVLTKSLRGNNPHNVVKATFAAFRKMRSSKTIADLRGLEVRNIRL